MAPLSRYGYASDDAHLLSQASQRALDEQAATLRRKGVVTPIAYASVTARWGDIVHIDPSNGPMTVRLPAISPADVGKTILVVNGTAVENAVTLIPDAATINGQSTLVVARAYWVREVLAVSTSRYVLTNVLDGQTSTAAARWRYLATTQPTGAPAPVEVWQFDASAGQLTGRVAGIALALSAGAAAQQLFMEHVGMVLLSSAQYATVTAAALQLVGDLTIEAVIAEKLPQGSSLSILACGDPNAALGVGTSQCCYAVRYSGTGYEELRYYHASAGLTTPQTYATGLTVPNYVAFTRAGSTVTAYLNGRQCASAGVAARPAAGGVGTSQFRLQRAQGDTTSSNETTWFSVRVSAAAYTPAQIAAAWAQVYS